MSRIAELIQMNVTPQRQGKWIDLVPSIERAINEVEVRTTKLPPITVQHSVPVTEPLVDQLGIRPPPMDRKELHRLMKERQQTSADRRDKQF